MKLTKFVSVYGENKNFDSIKIQMSFIYKYAQIKKNAKAELDGNKFTYAILASRELASPDELAIKKTLDRVSKLLDNW